MLHSFVVRPVRIRREDNLLGVTALRGIGYRWECRCGECGEIRREYLVALQGGRDHAAAAADAGHAASP